MIKEYNSSAQDFAFITKSVRMYRFGQEGICSSRGIIIMTGGQVCHRMLC